MPHQKNVTVIVGDSRKAPDKLGYVWDEECIFALHELKIALRKLEEYRFTFLENHDVLIETLRSPAEKIDMVLNFCDEGYLNNFWLDSNIPAVLEIFGIPYTGAGPRGFVYCLDKSLMQGIAKDFGIPVPDAVFLDAKDEIEEPSFGFPVIVKPNFGCGSIGITQASVARNPDELKTSVARLREEFRDNPLLRIEKFLPGKDLTVGIIGNPPGPLSFLGISEKDYSMLAPEFPKIYGYEAKWEKTSPYYSVVNVPSDLDEKTKRFLSDCSFRLFTRLWCRDYCRVDWRIDEHGCPRLLEVNSNPCWWWDGQLAKLAAMHNIAYHEMLRLILQAAEKRIATHPNRPVA